MSNDNGAPKTSGDINYGAVFKGGTQNISGTGNVFGGKDVTVNIVGGKIGGDDAAKLQELFSVLQKNIEVADAPEADKADAAEATQTLKTEVETTAKNPTHKPSRVTMNGLIMAFKKLGAPVFNAAMSIIGFPALGNTINQFAQALPEDK